MKEKDSGRKYSKEFDLNPESESGGIAVLANKNVPSHYKPIYCPPSE